MDSLFAQEDAAKAAASRVAIGTSGYSFRDWKGPFYPAGVPTRSHLQFYAQKFHCLEVNMTYYRLPEAAQLESMCNRTPAHFEFIVKLHADMTHQQSQDATLYRQFSEALAPMRQAGKCSGLLAQFPYAFRNTETSRSFLSRLRDHFPEDSLFVEFRHRDWIQEPIFSYLKKLNLAYVSVDEPQLPHLVPPLARATTDVGYVRLHGRNAKHWYTDATTDGDRYDYLYNEAELQEWATKIRNLINDTRRVFVFFNNCHAGKAPANAQAMRELLTQMGFRDDIHPALY